MAAASGAPARSTARYDAFISYSHAQSRPVAEALQAEVERFGGRWYRPRQLRIFRDETNLAAAPDLWSTIRTALASSEWFILMASPAAASSRWVSEEVRWWLENRDADRILIALTAGEIAWKDRDFDWDRTDALPTTLSGAFSDVPLWVDLKPLVSGPSTTVEDRPGEHRVRLGDFAAEFAAPLIGLDKDLLIGRHIRERRRLRRTVQAVVLTLCLLAAAAGTAAVIAFQQRGEAIRERNVAEARRIAATADAARQQRPDVALLLAVEALRIAPVAEAEASLRRTLVESPYDGSLLGHTAGVQAVAASAQGELVATAGDDGTAILWEVADPWNRARLATLTGSGGPIHALSFDGTGNLLATGEFSNDSLLWDVSDPARAHKLSAVPAPEPVRFFPRAAVLFAGGSLWDVSAPTAPAPLSELPGAETLRDVDISQDGTTLVMAARPGASAIWDVSDPRHPLPLGTIPVLADDATLSPDGRLVILAPESGPAEVWDLRDRARPTFVSRLAGPRDNVVFEAAFSPDGRTLCTANGDGIAVWDLEDVAQPVLTQTLTGHDGGAWGIAFLADGSRMVTGGADGAALVWLLDDKGAVRQRARLGPFQDEPIASFSSDGRTMVTATSTDPITVWDLSDVDHPAEVSAIERSSSPVWDVALSPDAAVLARSSSEQAPELWDLTRREQPAWASSLGNRPGVVTFASDGDTVAVRTTGREIDLWDVTDPRAPVRSSVLRPGGDGPSRSAVFGPDGRSLAVATSEAVELWDVLDLTRPRLLSRIAEPAVDVAFSPRGGLLATAGPGRVFSLWEVSRLEEPTVVSTVRGDDTGGMVGFSPDGGAVITGSAQAVAVVWNITEPTVPVELARVEGHHGSVYRVGFSPDGRTLQTGSMDLTLGLWDLPLATEYVRDPVAVACLLTGGTLPSEIRHQYLPGTPSRATC
ncbi:toll/interleukin-1 receptor domain-containing protein [Geodermatophilus sp. SYSU D00710]